MRTWIKSFHEVEESCSNGLIDRLRSCIDSNMFQVEFSFVEIRWSENSRTIRFIHSRSFLEFCFCSGGVSLPRLDWFSLFFLLESTILRSCQRYQSSRQMTWMTGAKEKRWISCMILHMGVSIFRISHGKLELLWSLWPAGAFHQVLVWGISNGYRTQSLENHR